VGETHINEVRKCGLLVVAKQAQYLRVWKKKGEGAECIYCGVKLRG